MKIYFDVWSNVHYGYVGRAAGFDEETLMSASHISLLAGRTDAGDDLSVRLGFELYTQTRGAGVTPEQIDGLLRANSWQLWFEQKLYDPGLPDNR